MTKPSDPSPSRTPPGPSGWDWIKLLVRSRRQDPVELLHHLRERHGRLVKLYHPLLGGEFLLVNHPDHLRHILVENQNRYGSPDLRSTRDFKRVMGDGLVVSEGDLWLQQHRLIMPFFQPDHVTRYGSIVVEETRTLTERWKPTADPDDLDLLEEMKRLTLRIIGRSLFGTTFEGHRDEIREAMTALRKGFHHRSRSLVTLPLWVPTPFHRKLHRAMDTLEAMAHRLIEERRGSEDEHEDLLSHLLLAEGDDGEPLSDEQVRDEIINLMIAGHETTAAALAWGFILLERHPSVQAGLRDEARAVWGEEPVFSEGHFEELDRARRVFRETLRLYPTVPIFGRTPEEDDRLDGCTVEAGTTVVISPYVLHRDPGFWTDPEAFDPDRFTDERDEPTHRFAYLPFSAGAHRCTGRDFALMEGPLILSLIARDHRLRLGRDPEAIRPHTAVNLEPSGSLPVEIVDGREHPDREGRR